MINECSILSRVKWCHLSKATKNSVHRYHESLERFVYLARIRVNWRPSLVERQLPLGARLPHQSCLQTTCTCNDRTLIAILQSKYRLLAAAFRWDTIIVEVTHRKINFWNTFVRNISGQNSCNWLVLIVQCCTDTFVESDETTCWKFSRGIGTNAKNVREPGNSNYLQWHGRTCRRLKWYNRHRYFHTYTTYLSFDAQR